jgi:hypothetical protein
VGLVSIFVSSPLLASRQWLISLAGCVDEGYDSKVWKELIYRRLWLGFLSVRVDNDMLVGFTQLPLVAATNLQCPHILISISLLSLFYFAPTVYCNLNHFVSLSE